MKRGYVMVMRGLVEYSIGKVMVRCSEVSYW